jgi:hypothetical protein
VPIIVCSAATNEVTAHDDELANTPQVFILAKPFSLEELEAVVQRALGDPVDAGSPR